MPEFPIPAPSAADVHSALAALDSVGFTLVTLSNVYVDQCVAEEETGQAPAGMAETHRLYRLVHERLDGLRLLIDEFC